MWLLKLGLGKSGVLKQFKKQQTPYLQFFLLKKSGFRIGVKNVISLKHPLWLSYKDKILKENLRLKSLAKNWKEIQKRFCCCQVVETRGRPLLPVFVRAVECLSNKWEIDLRIVSSENVDDSYYKPFLHLFNHVYESKFLGDALS